MRDIAAGFGKDFHRNAAFELGEAIPFIGYPWHKKILDSLSIKLTIECCPQSATEKKPTSAWTASLLKITFPPGMMAI
jgi:hypothetical protein